LQHKKVVVGVLPTIAPFFLPSVVSRFIECHPAIELSTRENLTAPLLKSLRAGDLDLALLTHPISGGKIKSEKLFEEELLLALPAQHPLAVKEKIHAADLANQRFIVIENDHCLEKQIFGFCEKSRLRMQILSRSSQLATIQALVTTGYGIALVPQMAKISGQTTLVYRSLEKPKPTRTIVVAWLKNCEHNNAVVEFLKNVRQVAIAFREEFQS
jgi:LysR family hydrogen peroxide-inducible transcriptional activator